MEKKSLIRNKFRAITVVGYWLMVTGTSLAQGNTKTVTGTVIDAATGQPMSGVIVSAYDNQRKTTMTDEQGRY